MEYAAFTTEGNSITLYRLYGTGPSVVVPDRIGTMAVETLADHLFAQEMSVWCSPEQMSLARLEKGSCVVLKDRRLSGSMREELEQEALSGDRVHSVHIPEGVLQIGNYAFYGLYQLREVSFPSTMRKIGWGMFNGCRNTSRLVFHLKEDAENTPPILKEILDSLPNELDVIVRKHGDELYRLRFPAYYEEGKENTPARIIEIIYHGTGRQYRNCFLNRVLQFDMYDEVFPLAAAQESPQTAVSLILNRMRSGPVPRTKTAQRYLDYLRKENTAMMEEILTDPDFDPAVTLAMLDGKDYFTSTNIDESVQAASRKGNAQAVGCLMEIRSRRFAQGTAERKKTRYEL